MKILVVSLLRIGDIVLTAPILRGLRNKFPHAEIHLMLNGQFKQVAPLLPYIDRFWFFDRERLQKGLGEASVPIFDSYERLQAQIDSLNGENYDLALNLTHNRLSGWLLSLISAKEKHGLVFDPQGKAAFGTAWFRYLNHQVDAEGEEVFHFTDVFRFALGIDYDPRQNSPALVETEKGRAEAADYLSSEMQGPVIAVQALTSDTKKDWGLESFARAIVQLQGLHPDAQFAILGAPFEKEKLTPLLTRLQDANVRARLAILSFEGAFSLLKRAKLLITGDTSIKHLASLAKTPIVEICLGSSDAHRTGAYQQGSIIIRSREACVPCVHSKACHRASHACGQSLKPDAVAMVASEVFSRRTFQLRTIAEEYAREVEILRVEMTESGFWAAPSLLEPFSEASVCRWLDLACRKLWLESTTRKSASLQMGTEIRRLAALLKSIHPLVSDIEWRHLWSDLERQAVLAEGRVNSFKIQLQWMRGHFEDPRKMREFINGLILFRERIRHSALLSSFKSLLDQVIEDDMSPAFTRFRRAQDFAAEFEKRTEIYLRLIRGLEGSTLESGEMETR